jgi:subtilisin-like proprotein convertase family protein
MSFFAFRRFFDRNLSRRSERGRKQRGPLRRRLHLEALELRIAPAATPPDVLPAAIINGQTALTSAASNNNPQTAVDPVAAQKIFEVHSTGGGLGGFYSSDSGQSFNGVSFNPISNVGLPLNTIDPVSVAIDRNEEVYVTFSFHASDFSSGAIELTRFNFSGGAPSQDLGYQVLYSWNGTDAAYNPTVIVDNNVPTYVDPQTGTQIVDTMSGKGVYVIWNTNFLNANGSQFTNDGTINMVVSADQGQTFSNVVTLDSGNQTLSPGISHPVGFFTQGTPNQQGGLLNVFYDSQTDPNTNTSGAILFHSRPDGGDPSRPVVSNVDFQGPGGQINEAIANAALPDTPVTTVYDLTLTADQFPAAFDVVKSLQVRIGLVHPDDRELTITLKTPLLDPVTHTNLLIHLLRNSIDDNHNTLSGQGIQSSNAVPNLGAIDINNFPDTVFDNTIAHRNITDPQNVAPFIGLYTPELDNLNVFDGLTPAQLAGTWELQITDNVNEAGNNNPIPPTQQFLNNWSLNFTSRLDATGSTRFIGLGALPSSLTSNYPTVLTAAGTPGVGPNLSVAIDNTLGAFSRSQGTIYVAYSAAGVNGLANGDSDIFLVKSTDGGASWSPPLRINNDTPSDNFSEGIRAQFMPELAVDPVTGTLVAMWYDARFDASNARVATFLATSIDGGNTFSPQQVYLNASNTAIDAITNQTRVIEPIPSNAGLAGSQAFGDHQGLAAFGGKVYPFWAGNANDVNAAIYTANVTIAAGPRVLQGDMGPVVTPGNGFNNTYAPDGTLQLSGFTATFDRYVDPSTFGPGQVQFLYHKPTDPAGVFTDLSGQVTSVQPLNLGVQPVVAVGGTIVRKGNTGNLVYANVPVLLSLPQATDTTVFYSTSDGSGTNNVDYVGTSSGSIVIPAGQTSGIISVQVLPNNTPEGNRTFFVQLTGATNGVGVAGGQGSATVTILDDNFAPALTVGDAAVQKSTNTTTTLMFPVYLAQKASSDVIVTFSTADGTAQAGTDYNGVTNGQITIPFGQITGNIPITVLNNNTAHGNLNFTLNVNSATNATVVRDRAMGTIVDASNFGLSAGDVAVQQGPNVTVDVPVYLAAASSHDIHFKVRTVNGTAIAGTDYQAVDSTQDHVMTAGTTVTTIPVMILNPGGNLSYRSFQLQLISGDANYLQQSGTVTIFPSGAVPTVTLGDVLFHSKAFNSGQAAQIPVQLSFASNLTVQVQYVVNGNGDDVNSTPTQTLTFNPGESLKYISVPVTSESSFDPTEGNPAPNQLPELNENFSVQVVGTTNATVARGTASNTIVDDNIWAAIDDATAVEGTGNQITFTVYLNAPAPQAETVNFHVIDGTAKNGTDYTTASTGSVMFNVGDTMKTIVINLDNNTNGTDSAQFTVQLTSASTGVGIMRGTGTGTIIYPQSVAGQDPIVSMGDVSGVQNNNGTETFTFTIYDNVAQAADFKVNWQTVDGTGPLAATAPTDYVSASGSTTITKNTTSATFTITIQQSTNPVDRQFFVQILLNKDNFYTIGAKSEGSGWIEGNDLPITVAVSGDTPSNGNDAVVVEDPNNSKVANFLISLSRAVPSTDTVTVSYYTSDGTGVEGKDYQRTFGTVTFQAGDISKLVPVTVFGSNFPNGNRSFFLNIFGLSSTSTGLPSTVVPTIYQITQPQATGVIVDDPMYGLAVGDATVQEVTNGMTTISFIVSLNAPAPPNKAINFTWSTLDGTAQAGTDYTAVTNGAGTIQAGQTSTTITVTVNANPQAVLNRFFHVFLSGPTDVNIVRRVGTGTILEDDAVPSLTLANTSAFEGDAAGETFTAFLSFAANNTVTASYSTQDGNGMAAAKAGTDYQAVSNGSLTFTPSANEAISQTFAVPLVNDAAVDPNETYFVNLGSPTNATIAQAQGTGLIVEKNAFPTTVNIGDALVRQGYYGQQTISFNLLLTNRSTSDVKVAWTTVNGSALAGVDYLAQSGVATIAAGQFSTTITITILGNSNFYQNATKQFFVQLTDVSGAQIGRSQGQAVILGDNGPNGATLYQVNVTPQSLVGDYSYAIGPIIQDRVRTASLPPGSTIPLPFSASGVPVAVPHGGSVDSTLQVPLGTLAAGQGVGNLTVNLNLAAFYDKNLTITLIAPNGSQVVLAQNRGGDSGHNYTNTTFDFTASTPIAQGAAPFTGTFRPDGILSLNGLNPVGTWTLRITDNGSGENVSSSLISWSLNIIPVTLNPGTAMDQDLNSVPGEGNNSGSGAASGDLFAAPGPANRATPALQVAYDPNTLPLIIPGPHVVATYVAGIASTGDNLTLNGPASSVDIVFDRDMDPTTFTPANIIRMVGPQISGQGDITGPFTVTANRSGTPAALAKRTFRISFPAQSLSGTYSIVISPSNNTGAVIQDLNGYAVDTNLNAGLDALRGFSNPPVIGSPTTYTTTTAVTIQPNATITSPLTINDQFIIQQDGTNHIGLRLNIQSLSSGPPINDPDLVAKLIAPTGQVITLFSNVPTKGSPPFSNFHNTTFDDFAASPIELATAPFDIGPYDSQFPLSQIKGLGSKGTWKLSITNKGTTSGTLTDWSLKLPPPLLTSGLGETMADQINVNFRIFTQDPTNVQSHNQWTAVGGAANNNSQNSGRIGGLAVDASDPSGNTVYAAGASGGVWKTNNFYSPNGPTWLPLTDLGPGNSLNTGSIAVFSQNHDTKQSIIFVSTGEGDTGTPGVGLLRSMDGGKTWTLLDSINNTDSSGNELPFSSRTHDFAGLTSFKVIVDPKPLPSGKVAVYVAFGGSSPNSGVWRSIDSGNTWQQVQQGDATDIALAAGSAGSGGGNLSILYAGIRGTGVFKTTSALTAVAMTQMLGGDGFPTRFNIDASPATSIPVTNPSDTPNGSKLRILLATPTLANNPLSDSNYQGWLYALVISPSGDIDDLYLTKDFGHNWTRMVIPFFTYPLGGTYPTNDETASSPYNPFGGAGGAITIPSQGNYDASLAIDPINPNVVYIGGQNDNTVKPAGGMIRVDVTQLNDPYAMVEFDNSNNDGGQKQSATTGTFDRDPTKPFGITDSENQNYFNIAFDPIHPRLTPSSLPFTNVTNFHNGGDGLSWAPVSESFLQGSTDQHRLLAVIDPLTGKTRLIAGDDQGIFTAVTNPDGTLATDGIGFAPSITGSRNGNIQITQFYYGASQPSSLAAEIQGALLYGMAQDDGFPTSDPHVLQNGNLNWVGPVGDGTGVATDQGGSGQVYQYRWPCCGAFPLASDFFLVQLPGHHGQDFISRITGLLQPGDDPAKNMGQWPLLGGSNFAVNPIDPTAIVMSSQAGRIFRTSGPLTGTGVQWFSIAEPGVLDSTYAPAEAFGAPNPAVPGVIDDFIYVGTSGGHIYVTTTGGSSWTNISTGLDGSAVQVIQADPRHGSDDAYAITLNGVYYTQHATAATFAGWTNITNNLFSLTTKLLNDPNLIGPALASGTLHSLAADWRFSKPNTIDSGTHPVLYVGGQGGVYRSDDQGATWRYFPSIANENAAVDGGFLANTLVTQLSLAIGNIDPNTGLPSQAAPNVGTGFNMLVATTYGRGTFAIRLDQTLPSSASILGPLVSSITNVSDSSTEAIQVTFGKTVSGSFVATPVDPSTFTAADIVLKDPNGNVLPVRRVIDVTQPNPNGSSPHNVYKIIFTGTSSGTYTVTIGPNLSDFSGDKMDQDQDSETVPDRQDTFTGSVSITPAARPTVGLPYSDSFAGNYGDSLQRQWLETAGYFLIQNNPGLAQNYAVAQAAGANTAILQLATAQAAVSEQADVNLTSTSGSSAGLLARYVDSNDFYLGRLHNVGGSYFAEILRESGGVLTQLNSAAVSSAAGTLRFEVVGSSLKLFLNNTLVTFVQDTTLSAAGNVGLNSSQGATFGNYSASAITLLNAPLPFNEDFSVPGPGGQLDRYWIDQRGNIADINGAAVGQSSFNLSTVNGINQGDIAVKGEITLSGSQWAALVTRYSGPLENNFYLGQLLGNGDGTFTPTIWKLVNGMWTRLNTGANIISASGTLEFESVGPSLKLFLNGHLLTFADDLDLTTGSVGIRIANGTTLRYFQATAVTQVNGSLPFTDTFNATSPAGPPSDGSQLSREWTDQTGNITVANGQAVGEGGFNLSTVNGINAADVSVTANINLSGSLWASLVARYNGPLEGNFYLGQLFGNGDGTFTPTIWKKVNGNWTRLNTGANITSASGTLEFETVGPSLKLILNGGILTWADDLDLTTGSIGMRISKNAAISNFQAVAVVQQNGSIPFSDTFAPGSPAGDPSDGSQLSREWTDQTGNITIIGGKATGEGAFNLSTVNGISQADVAVKGDIALSGSQWASLVARYSGPLEGNFYLGQLFGNGDGTFTPTIWKKVNGNWTRLNTGVNITNATGTVEFETVGASLKLILGGQILTWATDTDLTTGSVGMRISQNATVANYSATAVVQQNGSLPFSDTFAPGSPAGDPSDGSQLSREWTDQTGNITIVNGKATGEGAFNLSTVNGIHQADIAVKGDIALTGTQWASLVARYSGPFENNFYLGQLFGNGDGTFTPTIYKKVNGNWTRINTGANITNATGTLEFETVGPSLKLILGGQILTWADDTDLKSGSVGMRISQNATVANYSATAVMQQNGSIPFNDTFGPGSMAGPPSDGSQLSREWTDQRGNITVSGGQAVGKDAFDLSTVNGINVADVTVSADMTVGSGQFASLVARYSGPLESNFYLAQIQSVGAGFQASIYKNINGVFTQLVLVSAVTSGTGNLKFVLAGSSLKLYLDNNLLASATDTDLTSGSVGMRLGLNASFANFNATSP